MFNRRTMGKFTLGALGSAVLGDFSEISSGKELTTTQEDICKGVKEYWIKVGLNCEPTNVEKTMEAMGRAYKQINQEAPPKISFLYDSPCSCAIAQAISDKLVFKSGSPGPVGREYRQQTKNLYPMALSKCLRQLREKCGFVATKAELESVALENLNLDYYMEHFEYGSDDAPWLAFYDVWRKLGHIKETEPLVPLMDIAHHCGWYAAYDETVFLVHRHAEIHLDTENNLHNDNGPSVLYRDGFSMYHRHGELREESPMHCKMLSGGDVEWRVR